MERVRAVLAALTVGVVAYWLGIAAAAVALTVGATLLSWDWPLIVLLAIGTVALGLFTINQYHVVHERWKKPFADRPNEEIETTLRDWLFAQGLTIRADPQPNAHFQFLAEDSSGRRVVIGRLHGDEAFITVGAMLSISPEDKPILEAMPESVRLNMLDDIKIELARFGISYDTRHAFEAITITDKIPCDDTLTQFLFGQRIGFTRRALVLIMVILNRAARNWQEQQEEQSGDESPTSE